MVQVHVHRDVEAIIFLILNKNYSMGNEVKFFFKKNRGLKCKTRAEWQFRN